MIYIHCHRFKDHCPGIYRGPELAAEVTIKYIPDEEQRRDVALLDVAAGTGFLGSLVR